MYCQKYVSRRYRNFFLSIRAMCIPRLFLTQVVDLYWYPLEYATPKKKDRDRVRGGGRERDEHSWDQNELRFSFNNFFKYPDMTQKFRSSRSTCGKKIFFNRWVERNPNFILKDEKLKEFNFAGVPHWLLSIRLFSAEDKHEIRTARLRLN